MCGIVYSKSFVGKPVNKTIMKRYIKQRSRGSDGFGFYTPETNRLTHNPREGRIMSLLRRNKKATEILFHHRMPTSTINVRNACHPFSTKDYFKYNYVLVHNGVLWNEHELKKEHEQRGIDYVSEQEDGSFNDSEALAYDVARYIEGEVSEIKAEGSIAFICIQRTHEGEPVALYFGRNSGNPLKISKTKKGITIASEGDGELVKDNELFCMNYKTGVITSSPCRIPTAYKGGAGYGYGYGYSGYYEDDEFDEIAAYNAGFGIKPEETARYFRNESKQGKAYAEAEVKRLLDENYESRSMAADAGEDEIAGLQKIVDDLRNPVEVWDSAPKEDVERFYMLEDRIYYLKLAVKALQGGSDGSRQMGFHYTPDHDWRDRTRERIDPVTGYAYYPYAE